MEIIDRKLPRNGICPIVFSDSCLRRFNIAEVKTDFVISEKNLFGSLMIAQYVFPVMEKQEKVMEAFRKY